MFRTKAHEGKEKRSPGRVSGAYDLFPMDLADNSYCGQRKGGGYLGFNQPGVELMMEVFIVAA